MSVTVNEYIVDPGEHIATVQLVTGEATKVIFDKSYYYFYLKVIGGSIAGLNFRIDGIPEVDEVTLLPKDGTRRMDCSGLSNTFHETYSNFLYLYNVNGSATNEVEIIATNNKNINSR